MGGHVSGFKKEISIGTANFRADLVTGFAVVSLQ